MSQKNCDIVLTRLSRNPISLKLQSFLLHIQKSNGLGPTHLLA